MTTLTEPAGWGQPGTIRHAEEIGHTVWLDEHPESGSEKEAEQLDAMPTDEFIARSVQVRADIDQALANVRKVFGTEAMCPIPLCIRKDHPVYELCEDAVGHTWFQGDGAPDEAGGIQL